MAQDMTLLSLTLVKVHGAITVYILSKQQKSQLCLLRKMIYRVRAPWIKLKWLYYIHVITGTS